MKITFILAVLYSFMFLNCQSQQKNLATIDVITFEKQLLNEKNAQLVDVRTPQEYSKGKINNAINIDWNNPNFIQNISTLDKSKPIYIYCLSGGRSKAAAEKLQEVGFKQVYNLDGGILKWNDEHQNKNNTEKSTKTEGISIADYNKILQKSPKTIVNVYAEWCAPCKVMTPYILKMQKEMKDNINIVRFDADANKTLLEHLHINSLPVILIYENDKLIWQYSGYLSEVDLRKQL